MDLDFDELFSEHLEFGLDKNKLDNIADIINDWFDQLHRGLLNDELSLYLIDCYYDLVASVILAGRHMYKQACVILRNFLELGVALIYFRYQKKALEKFKKYHGETPKFSVMLEFLKNSNKITVKEYELIKNFREILNAFVHSWRPTLSVSTELPVIGDYNEKKFDQWHKLFSELPPVILKIYLLARNEKNI